MPGDRPSRSCEFDGRPFVPRRKDQRFCSRKCQRSAVVREYHREKWRTGEEKRARYSVRKMTEELASAQLARDAFLDGIAAIKEAEEQVKLWTARLSVRREAIKSHGRPEGLEVKGRVLKDGEPVGEPIERAVCFGVASTDGLVAVVVFGRPV